MTGPYPGPDLFPGPDVFPGVGDDTLDVSRLGAEWSLWSRSPAPSYALTRALPIISISLLVKHLGVSTAVVKTPYSEAAYAALQPSCGVVLYRNGRQEFSGLVGPLELDWDEDSGQQVIIAECLGDEVALCDRLAFPDPLRADDDQTVNDYWTYTGVASTAMWQLISDQAGPTCRASRQVSGLTLGADPGVGLSRKWSALFDADGPQQLLDTLATISVSSGANLGVRLTSDPATGLTADIVQPRDFSDSVKFSVEFGNVAGIKYRIEPPSVTNVVAAGQGDLHLRLRRKASTTDTFALSWARRIWRYIDRRDTADTAELDKANTDALAEGAPSVTLAATLLDTDAATYGQDWQIGDRITLYVRMPGQTAPAETVTDVVREIAFDVDDKGVETIRPAVGSWDAKAIPRPPSLRQLADIRASLAGLRARK